MKQWHQLPTTHRLRSGKKQILKRCQLCNSNGALLGFTGNIHILCTDLCNTLIMNISSEFCILDSVCFFLNWYVFSVSPWTDFILFIFNCLSPQYTPTNYAKLLCDYSVQQSWNIKLKKKIDMCVCVFVSVVLYIGGLIYQHQK